MITCIQISIRHQFRTVGKRQACNSAGPRHLKGELKKGRKNKD